MAEVFDALVGVAIAADGFIPRFLEVVRKHHEALLAIVDESNLDHLEASLHERVGEIDDASVICQRLFYRFRAEENWDEVDQVLSDLKRLQAGHIDLDRS